MRSWLLFHSFLVVHDASCSSSFAVDPLPSYRLGALAENFGIDTQGAHRAQKDVHMTIALQQALFSLLEQAKSPCSSVDLLRLQYLPLPKAVRLLQG